MSDYQASLAETSRLLLDASMGVVAHLPELDGYDNELVWSVQTEVVWTLLGAILRGVFNLEGGGRQARDDIQDAIIPIMVNDMLDAGFDWPPNSEELRAGQYQSLLEWFDKAEADNASTVRFMSSEPDFFQMMLTGEIPEDSLVSKLCRRVSAATGEAGNGEFIQSLFLGTAQAHVNVGLNNLTAALVEARNAEP